MKRGIFGGTFNPVHNGHLINARLIREEFLLDEIIFIPTGDPVHKKLQGNVSPEDRYSMVSLAIQGTDGFSVSRIEIDRSEASYTVLTLRQLKKNFPEDTFYLVIGADSFNELDTWCEYGEIIQSVPIIVMKRPGDPELKSELVSRTGELHVASNPDIEISSSMIRKRADRGLSLEGFVPAAVEEYIESKRLYKS